MKRFLLKLGKICLVVLFAIIALFGYLLWRNMYDVAEAQASLTNYDQFKEEVIKEFGLTIGLSEMVFSTKIDGITLGFYADYCENVEGARKIAVGIIHKIIEGMNNPPVSMKNVIFTISFKEENDSFSESIDSVMVIGLRNKIVYVRIENRHLKIVQEETFDVAEQIVQHELSV